MEDIAVEHSAAQGWPMERYFTGGNAWVAASHFIEYLRPAFAGDTLDIHTWIATWDRRTSIRRYAVTRQRKLVARGETCWTFVEIATGRACDLPAAVTQAFIVVSEDDDELQSLGLARRSGYARRSSPAPECGLSPQGYRSARSKQARWLAALGRPTRCCRGCTS